MYLINKCFLFMIMIVFIQIYAMQIWSSQLCLWNDLASLIFWHHVFDQGLIIAEEKPILLLELKG